MRILTISLSLVLMGIATFPGYAQTSGAAGRGAEAEIPQQKLGTVRAVIAGISTYKNLPPGKQLNYAHVDAESFYEFLYRHPSTDKDGLIKMVNAEASADKFRTSINGLIRKSVAGDMIMVYFAGHGNVQSDIDEGFLLFSDVTANDTDYFADDAFKLSDLKDYGLLCGKRGIKFVVITDACRSGKILDEKGAKNTLSVLSAEWQYTAKLISCQASQSSFEYSDIGHGAFTYYLVQTLKGLYVDKLRDDIIEFFELQQAMNDPIMAKTNFKQMPAWSGDADFQIIEVDPRQKEEVLAASLLKEPQKAQLASNNIPVKETAMGVSDAAGALLNLPEVSTFYESLEKNLLVNNPYDKKRKVSAGEITQIHAFPDALYTVALNPDETWLAVASGKGTSLKLYDLTSNKMSEVTPSLHGDGGVLSMQFSPDGKYLVTGGWSGTINLWDLTTKAKVAVQTKSTGVRSMVFSHDGKIVATGDNRGKIQLWSFPEFNTVMPDLNGHQDRITDLRFSGNDSTLYSASADKNIKIWTLYMKNHVTTLPLTHSAPINAMEVESAGKYMCTGDESGTIIRWDLVLKKAVGKTKVKAKTNYKPTVNDLVFSQDSKYLLVAGNQSYISVLSSDSLADVTSFLRSTNGITCAVLSKKNHFVYATTFAGDLVRTNLVLPDVFAQDIYEASLKGNPRLKSMEEKLQTDFIARLLEYAQDVVQPFIAGIDILPDVHTIHKAVLGLEYASTIGVHSEVIDRQIRIRLLYLKGMKILQENNFTQLDDAQSYFEEILKLDVNATYPHNAISLVLKKKNDLVKANQRLGIASAQIPKWTEPKGNLGRNYLSEGKFDEAQKSFTEIITLEPDISKGYRWMGELYFVMGDLVKAEGQWMTALKKEPGNALLVAKMSLLESIRRKYAKAEELLTKSMQMDTALYLPHLYFGDLNLDYFRNHQRNPQLLQKAFQYYQRSLILSKGTEPSCYLALGKVYAEASHYLDVASLQGLGFVPTVKSSDDFKTKYTNMAIEYLDKAITLAPHDGEAYYYKAKMRSWSTGNESDGLTILGDYKFSDHDGYQGQLYMGKYYYDHGNFESAGKYLRDAVRSNRRFYTPYLTLLPVLVKLKEWDEIKSLESELAGNEAGNPVVLTSLAGALAFSPEGSSRTVHYCDAALKADPAYGPARMTKNTYTGKPMGNGELHDELGFSYSSNKYLGKNFTMLVSDEITYLADISGNLISPFPYKPEQVVNQEYIIVQDDESKFGVTDFHGDTLISVAYDKVELDQNYLIVTKGKLQGLYSDDMKQIMAVKYQDIQVHDEAIVYKFNERYGAADLRGKTIVKPVWSKISFEKYKLMKRAIKADNGRETRYYNFKGECLNCK